MDCVYLMNFHWLYTHLLETGCKFSTKYCKFSYLQSLLLYLCIFGMGVKFYTNSCTSRTWVKTMLPNIVKHFSFQIHFVKYMTLVINALFKVHTLTQNTLEADYTNRTCMKQICDKMVSGNMPFFYSRISSREGSYILFRTSLSNSVCIIMPKLNQGSCDQSLYVVDFIIIHPTNNLGIKLYHSFTVYHPCFLTEWKKNNRL